MEPLRYLLLNFIWCSEELAGNSVTDNAGDNQPRFTPGDTPYIRMIGMIVGICRGIAPLQQLAGGVRLCFKQELVDCSLIVKQTSK